MHNFQEILCTFSFGLLALGVVLLTIRDMLNYQEYLQHEES